MKFAIDTNAYSAFVEGDTILRRLINEKSDIIVPIVVIGELRAGFAAGSQRERNEQLLLNLLDTPNVEIKGLSLKATEYYAEIFSRLKRIGKPIQTNDMWIAALCLEHKLPLLTLDKDYAYITGLKIVDVR